MSLRSSVACTAALVVAAAGALAPLLSAQRTGDEERFREAARLAGAALADLEAGNLGRAEDGFERLSRLLPDNALPWIDLGVVYLLLDRTDEALAALERAREIDPDNPQLLYTEAKALELRAATDRTAFARWERTLERLAALDAADPRPFWLRGRFLGEQRRWAEARDSFVEANERSRDNLVILVDWLVAAASSAEVEATSDALDAIEDRLNGFEDRVDVFAERLRAALATGPADALRPAALVLENLLRPTDLYQVGRAELHGRQGGAFLFPQLDFVPPLPKTVQGGADIEIALRDVTRESGLSQSLAGRAVADVALRRSLGDDASAGDTALLVLDDGLAELAFDESRAPLRRERLPRASGADKAWSHDFDQDAVADLLIASGGELVLHPGVAGGGWAAPRPVATLDGPVLVLEPVDLDYDGDLDLIAGGDSGLRYLQNRGSGGFADATSTFGEGFSRPYTGAALADFDQDGDLDLLLVGPSGAPRLLLDRRTGAFEDATEGAGLGGVAPARAASAADFDRDGSFDVLLWGGDAPPRVLLNRDGSFELVALGPDAAGGIEAAAVADLDNDGDQDVVTARGADLVLWRGHGDGTFTAEHAAQLREQVASLLALDLDADGDLDLLGRTSRRGALVLRNEGGERNHWLRVALRGLVQNNAKNNSEGLHALVEVRTGGEYQAALGNGGVNHFGLGARRQADVLRVVWSNGLAQTWQQLAARQTLIEEQVLKGSCPFLYTYDGEGFRFVTDLLWRSTLGMRFADGAPAPHQSARDWVLVPGEALHPTGGELWMQMTSELWETIYVDRQALLAVDLPPGIEAVVDESFRPPPHPTAPPLYLVERWIAPSRARDGSGRDVLAALASRDGVHVDGLPLTRYQGATSGHELVIELAHEPSSDDGALLVLWGWIFPTDTSINLALAQDPAIDAAPPSLDVRLADGSWQNLLPSIGIPMGKRKAVVVELGDALDRAELVGRVATPLELRLRTTMQIYWDAAALGFTVRRGTAPWTRLEPKVADLHYRGFSRLFRESPSGPHLFDYHATSVESPFPPMTGRYTRYGAVLELLRAEDDRYAVMAPGDELTLVFDANELPALPDGYTRDFVLYSDGWVKDADRNTGASTTVEPWPYHAMTGYPPPESPDRANDDELRRWIETYQTRRLDDAAFRDRLRARAADATPRSGRRAAAARGGA